MPDNILDLPVSEILRRYRSKTLSPVDVMQASLAQVRAFNPRFNAFVLLADEADLLKQAEASAARWAKGEPQGVLDGIPTTVKDGANVIGWPTRDGSAITPTTPMDADAVIVSRLRDAGAIFIGKTTTPEFGHKGVTDSPTFGITRNPWNAAKTSGGSSGGAGVAAATGMGLLHHGTDGGGSVRIPASFCGVFGLKATQSVLPSMPSLFTSLASAGPMTRYVEDAALMLEVMSGIKAYADLSESTYDLRVAYVPTMNNVPVDKEVDQHVRAAVNKLATIVRVEEIALDIPKMTDTFEKHWMAVAAWILNQIPEEKHAQMDPYLVSWAARGKKMALNDYLDAELQRLLIIEQVNALFAKYDAVIMPTMPIAAFDAGTNMTTDAQGQPWEHWTPFTYIANLAKLPAASLPCGMTSEGLPVGLHILSAPFKDHTVLKLAHALEQGLAFKSWLSRQEELYPGEKRKSA